MLTSSLRYPDTLAEQDESLHNEAVAHLLSRAYSCLQQAKSVADAYVEAHAFAKACFAYDMSKRQLMRVHYAYGTASLGLSEHYEGIVQLNEAIERAAELPDPGAYAQLAYLAADASRNLCCHSAAVDYAKVALGILRFLADGRESIDPKFESNVLICLATSEFTLALYSSAENHLQQARCLTSSLHHDLVPLAAVSMLESLLFRWRGQPELGLHHALAATDIFNQMPESPISLLVLGRASSVVTDIALDLAGSFPSAPTSSASTAYVELARPYINKAIQTARQIKDTGGLHVAMLIQARFDCLTGRKLNRVRTIERVIQHAQKNSDKVLQTQGFTALGREYTGLGRQEEALHCYRRALDAIAGTDAPAIGAFARRGLLLAQEMWE
jgi:tetratricopeptide (TPR) repeat protein